MRVVACISLDREVAAKVEELAKAQKISISQFIARVLKEHFEREIGNVTNASPRRERDFLERRTN